MKLIVRAVALLIVVASLSGCLTYLAPVMPPAGILFTKVSAPIDTDMKETMPYGPRIGKSSSFSLLGLVAAGNASVSEAAGRADITSVNNVEYEYMNVLVGVYQQFTIVVHGE
jgi:hypothetical protein